MDPPRSLPTSRAERPALIATAEPPEEPPAVRDGSHGLFVVPNAALYVWMSIASVERFVLPKTIAPAALRRATTTASRAGTWSIRSGVPPEVVLTPSVSNESFTVIGRP